MDRIWPAEAASLQDSELEELYRYPPEPARPWMRVNFVSSLDGAVSTGGSSRGFSSAADRQVLGLVRDLCDVVLVGARTADVEGYRGLRRIERRTERRRRFGLRGEVPPVAVVTGNCSITADSPLLTDTFLPPIVLTSAAAPQQRRDELAEAGADVVVTGEEQVDLAEGLRALDERGLRRVACEGGPTLFGELVAADLVDELCLTVAPALAGGDAGRIATGPKPDQLRGMQLLSAVRAESMLFLRYGRG